MSYATGTFEYFPPLVIQLAHWLAALLVLAEALNKLQRTDMLAPRIGGHARLVLFFKIAAWFLLAVGAAGAMVTPLLGLERPTPQDAAVMVGFALLIVRSRLKEALV